MRQYSNINYSCFKLKYTFPFLVLFWPNIDSFKIQHPLAAFSQ
jgi:hypothetical protein